jgi:hypothetical protein
MAPLRESHVDRANVFHRDGHYWTLAYGGMLVRLKDSKGLRDIARLIERAGSRLHVLELASLNGAADSIAVERARVAVTMRIHNALGRIAKEHRGLGRHLSNSVKTGAFCTYEPEIPVKWKL